MLKYQNWYAGIWIAVVGLYALGWSSLNGALDPALLVFFWRQHRRFYYNGGAERSYSLG